MENAKKALTFGAKRNKLNERVEKGNVFLMPLYLCIHTPENDFKQPLPQMRNITGGEKNANI